MDDASDPFSIPWWIWVAGGFILLAGIVIFAIKYQKHDDQQYRPHRESHSSGRRSRRHKHRSRRSE